jgi:hypothetical protein
MGASCLRQKNRKAVRSDPNDLGWRWEVLTRVLANRRSITGITTGSGNVNFASRNSPFCIAQWREVALLSNGVSATPCHLLILRPVVQMPFRTIRHVIRKAVASPSEGITPTRRCRRLCEEPSGGVRCYRYRHDAYAKEQTYFVTLCCVAG